MSSGLKPSVYAYTDYRRFLADQSAYAKAAHGFSLRALSQRAGIRSSSYLRLVIDGERNRGYERLFRFRPFLAVHQLAREQAAYHSQCFMPAIRELVRRADFKDDPAWVAQQLEPKISPAQAEKAIATLLELRLLRRQPGRPGGEQAGRLAQTTQLVTTGAGPLGQVFALSTPVPLDGAAPALDERDDVEKSR